MMAPRLMASNASVCAVINIIAQYGRHASAILGLPAAFGDWNPLVFHAPKSCAYNEDRHR